MSTKRLNSILLLLCLLALGLFILFQSRPLPRSLLNPLSLWSNPQTPPPPTPDPLRPINLLLLGYAGKNHDGGNLSDTIMVVNLNPKTAKATLISIPRDLWVSLPITQESNKSFKINHAWAIGNDDKTYPSKPAEYQGSTGGINLAKYAVMTATGLQIDYVIAVDFTGFKNLINLIGPLKVNVPYSFDDYYYPLTGEEQNPCGRSPEDIVALTATLSGEKLEREFPCRFEHLHFDRGEQVMDAETALKFVRSRHSEVGGGDFGRLERQQALIAAVKSKLFSPTIIPKVGSLIDTAYKSIRTDLDLDFVKEALKNYRNPNDFEIRSLTLNQKDLIQNGLSADRQFILIPVLGENNFSAIHNLVQSTLSATASASIITPKP